MKKYVKKSDLRSKICECILCGKRKKLKVYKVGARRDGKKEIKEQLNGE